MCIPCLDLEHKGFSRDDIFQIHKTSHYELCESTYVSGFDFVTSCSRIKHSDKTHKDIYETTWDEQE